MRRSSSSVDTDFDWQQLRQLAGEDSDFEVELLTLFLNDTDNNLRQLEQAIAVQNMQTIEDVAHALRGASVNVGASAIARVAAQMESVAHKGEGASAAALLKPLQQHHQSVKAQLQAKYQI